MTRTLILHPSTKKQLDFLVESSPNAVLLVGPEGSGKNTAAKSLAEITLGIPDIDKYPYTLIIDSIENKAIGIEEVRQIDQFLSLKVPVNKTKNRVIIINSANKLTTEAQNALLKTLEEVPLQSLIILCTTDTQALLPTVRSRLQAIYINKPDKHAIKQLFSEVEEDIFEQNYSLSQGLPGRLTQLLSNEDASLSDARNIARDILTKTPYERLAMVDSLSKNRQLSIDSINLIKQMADVSLTKANNSNRWQKILSASYEASEALNKNGQTKLVLTKLMLNL